MATASHALATDATLQATNTALGLLGKDTSVQAIATAIAALPNATQAAANAANAAAAAATQAAASIAGIVAETYSTSKTYAKGDYVYYNGDLYRCGTDIEEAESWTASHWSKVSLADDVRDIESTFGKNVLPYSLKRVSTSSTASGYKLNGTGSCVEATGYYLYKYSVTAGETYYIQSTECYQWQDSSNVPVGTNTHVIGTPVVGEKYAPVQVPAGATYLIVSVATGSNSGLYNYYTFKSHAMPAEKDLDALLMPGFYFTDQGVTYNGNPLKNKGIIIVYPSPTVNNEYCSQTAIDLGNGNIFNRVHSGSPATWSNWVPCAQLPVDLANGTDFDTLTEQGYWFTSYGGEYPNNPMANTGLLVTYKSPVSSSGYRVQVAYEIATATMYIRVRSGATPTWQAWHSNAPLQNTLFDSYTPASQVTQGENIGEKLRVLSYNICNFNNDTATYVPDQKLFNIKKMFYKANADILLLQEDNAYIDSSSSKASYNYVYLPVYPTKVGEGGVTIRSKMSLTGGGIVEYTNGRQLRYSVYESGSIKLLLVSTHPVWNYNNTGGESADSIAARKTQYEELFDWISGDITLNAYGTTTPVTVPTYTHCIIGMDANSVLADDKANLTAAATGAGFIMGNGGAIGWFVTEMRGDNSASDNIIVSNNIIINSIESYCDLYGELYSDHVPIIADLTLLES